jgi:hypothetical protein
MKNVADLLDDLLRTTRPPKGCAITLRECKSSGHGDTNWIAGTGHMPQDALSRYEAALVKLRIQNRTVDWSGVETKDGEWRSLAKYASGMTD